MKRTHLGVQAAIVLALVALVSWPQYRPLRAQTVWRYAPSAVQQARTDDAARYGADSPEAARRTMGVGPAAYTTTAGAQQSPAASSEVERTRPFFIPDAVAAAGGKLNALLGVARTSLNMPIPYARVVLRNIRTGQVQARSIANEQGRFSFLDLDASAYIVELIGTDGSVLASSAMVSVNRGDVRQTEVRAAASASTVTASFGDTLTSTLPQATTVASNSDVTRTTPALTTQESPR